MPPPNENGPQGGNPETHNEIDTDQAQALRVTVPRQRKPRHVPGQTGLFDVPETPPVSRKAFASLFAPDGVRKRWSLKYRCPRCGKYHGGQAVSREEADGKRTARCGRVVEIDVKRVYGEVGL